MVYTYIWKRQYYDGTGENEDGSNIYIYIFANTSKDDCNICFLDVHVFPVHTTCGDGLCDQSLKVWMLSIGDSTPFNICCYNFYFYFPSWAYLFSP